MKLNTLKNLTVSCMYNLSVSRSLNLAVTSFGRLENWIENVSDQLTRLNNRYGSGSEFQFGYLNQRMHLTNFNLDQFWTFGRIKYFYFRSLSDRHKAYSNLVQSFIMFRNKTDLEFEYQTECKINRLTFHHEPSVVYIFSVGGEAFRNKKVLMSWNIWPCLLFSYVICI